MRDVEWRIAHPNGWDDGTTFHAYNQNDNQICDPFFGLFQSARPPTEAGPFCPDCMKICMSEMSR